MHPRILFSHIPPNGHHPFLLQDSPRLHVTIIQLPVIITLFYQALRRTGRNKTKQETAGKEMEGSSQGSRRTYSSRPESRGSNNTRMTSTTSDGSADHLPQRTHVSTLLQDRLRERKSESARHSRRVSVDMESTSDRAAQSSPLKSLAREERRPSSSGISKTLGVKQIEEVSPSTTVQDVG